MNAEALTRHVSDREQGWLPRPAIAAIIFVNIALVIATITAFARFGSVQTALGYWLRGETLFVDAKEKSLGVVAPGTTVTASFKLTNTGCETASASSAVPRAVHVPFQRICLLPSGRAIAGN